MAIKTNGAELKRFYADKQFWPDDNGETHEDEVELVVNGAPMDEFASIEEIADAAAVTIAYGRVFGPGISGRDADLIAYFKKWQKRQSMRTLLVECDIDKIDAVIQAIKAAGGKVFN